MYIPKQLEGRITRLERELKKVLDFLELSSTVDPFNWQDLTKADKTIIRCLLAKKYEGATTTRIADELGMDKPKTTGRAIIWRKLRRIQRISKRMKGAPIVIPYLKRWVMNYDEFTFKRVDEKDLGGYGTGD